MLNQHQRLLRDIEDEIGKLFLATEQRALDAPITSVFAIACIRFAAGILALSPPQEQRAVIREGVTFLQRAHPDPQGQPSWRQH